MTVPIPSVNAGGAVRSVAPHRGADAEPDPPPVEPVADALATATPYVDAATPVFEGFYRDSRDSVARAVALALGDVHLAAEATDEAMVRAYERWGQVGGLDKPEAWVYRVALNWSMSALRRRRRSDHRLCDPRVIEMPSIGDPAVATALAELDVKHRSVVVCRHLLGWSVDETAAALKIRAGTVKSRLHRANRILQSRLQHLEPSGEDR
jgi:RNA polymerase sigma factor (sigma-70 family)